MMNGKIMAESEYGKGTVFIVEIPLVKGSSEEIKNEFDEGDILKEQMLCAPEAKVMVVDDNEFNLKTVEALLSLLEIKATLVNSGRKAIDLVKNEAFDIVFMDHMMPDTDGIEATHEIRKWEKEQNANETDMKHSPAFQCRRIPIIALTANAVQGAKEMFLSNGFDDFVSKPVDMRELKKALFKWLTEERIKLKDNIETGYEIKKSKIKSVNDMDFQMELKRYFVKSSREKLEEITSALEMNDIKLAHRCAHTLKGNAGQIGKTVLQKASEEIEFALKDGKNMITEEQMSLLETEFKNVISQLDEEIAKWNETHPAEESPGQDNNPLDAQASLELIEKLESLLKKGNPESLYLLEDLRRIQGTSELRQQIEDFDFSQALVSLADLKERILK
jgi:CheY-like chemotaxis protein/HPt (histidine-containing phosphotransfer) domain-containing protein